MKFTACFTFKHKKSRSNERLFSLQENILPFGITYAYAIWITPKYTLLATSFPSSDTKPK
jgi:hypothetical protein